MHSKSWTCMSDNNASSTTASGTIQYACVLYKSKLIVNFICIILVSKRMIFPGGIYGNMPTPSAIIKCKFSFVPHNAKNRLCIALDIPNIRALIATTANAAKMHFKSALWIDPMIVICHNGQPVIADLFCRISDAWKMNGGSLRNVLLPLDAWQINRFRKIKWPVLPWYFSAINLLMEIHFCFGKSCFTTFSLSPVF